MTILQINKFFYRRGGADHHFLDLCDLLEEKGEKVVVFSMRDRRNRPSIYEKYFVSNVEYGSYNWKAIVRFFRIMYSFEAKRKLAALIVKEKPDVAHLHLIYHHLSPSVLVALKQAKIPVVMTIHDWKAICPNYSLFTEGSPCERCRGGRYIECARHRCMHQSAAQSYWATLEAYFHHAKKYYENYIDLLIAPSQFVKEKFVHFGWPEDKITVLRHFLPVGFPLTMTDPLPPPAPRFAYVGRLSVEKGIDRLVEWWIKNKIGCPLDIFGDGPLMKKITKITSETKTSGIVLHGQVSRETVYANLDDTTAVIMPSVGWETFGLTAIESWARGIPVVASDRGAFTELVNQSGAGLLFDWDKNNLSEALIKAADPVYRHKAVAYMNSNHFAGQYYDELKNIYRGLASK